LTAPRSALADRGNPPTPSALNANAGSFDIHSPVTKLMKLLPLRKDLVGIFKGIIRFFFLIIVVVSLRVIDPGCSPGD
jgi:hypothetical protein